MTRSLSTRLASTVAAASGAPKAAYRFAMAYRRERCLHSGLHALVSVLLKLYVTADRCPTQDIDGADVRQRIEDKDGSNDQRKDRAMTRLSEPCAQSEVQQA